MKFLLKLSASTLLSLSSLSYAVNPYEGTYAGIMLGGSYTPSSKFYLTSSELSLLSDFFPAYTVANPATLKYSGYGLLAGMFGYRFNQFRVEAEVMYNKSPYQNIKTGNLTVLNLKKTLGMAIQGYTTTAAAMVNGFYDIYTPGDDCNIVPYVGLGIGYARVQNSLKFLYSDINVLDSRQKEFKNSPAAQGIIGFSYFIDDYTAFGLDYRYITTSNTPGFNRRVQLNTLNLSFTGSIDCF